MDQHPHSLGGVQTSVMLQTKYLNRSGVQVTIFAPKSTKARPDPNIKVLPSNYLPIGREYSNVWSLRKAAKFCEEVYKERTFDIVHVQGDFAAASLGAALAKRHNLPLVHTEHTNVDVMANKLIGKPLKMILLKFFTWQYGHFLKLGKRPRVFNAFDYAGFILRQADLVIAPSKHYAELLKEKGAATSVQASFTGVDDDEVAQIKRNVPVPNKPISFVWAARMLPEKRLIQTIEAFARSKVKAHLNIYGIGPLEKVAKNLVRARLITKRVTFRGRVPHSELLQIFANADVVMQTSIGFETQGLTVYESAAVGTPVLLCDPKIAAELPKKTYWLDKSGTIKSLSKTIRKAADDISEGANKRDLLKDPTWLLQSALTKEMIATYERLITEKKTAEQATGQAQSV
jgi:glycosyltransferase involved in cell wall biosynthesis